MNTQLYHQAEALRKARRYDEALGIFRDLWEQEESARVGAAIAHCLRKTGRPLEAEEAASKALARDPGNQWAITEMAWAVFDGELRASLKEGNLERAVPVAEDILNITKDPLITGRVIFAIAELAREQNLWDTVLEWCGKMTPEELKNVPPEGGKIRISDRERWYYASIRACLKLERWEQALELARKASEEFPGRIDFSRWNAQALAGLGQPGEALLEMEELLKKCRSEWYVLADYAELKAQLGERQEALRKACSAALMPGEKKAKVNLYLLLAKLFLADGREEQARIHVALTVGTRKEEGWSLPEELTRLAQRLGVSLDSGGQEGERLYGICRECWQREASEGKQWRKGVVINIPEGAHFAFIKCEDFEENIFVLQRDLPPAACRKGARVRFIEEASFDKKKNRESFRAIEVQAGE